LWARPGRRPARLVTGDRLGQRLEELVVVVGGMSEDDRDSSSSTSLMNSGPVPGCLERPGEIGSPMEIITPCIFAL